MSVTDYNPLLNQLIRIHFEEPAVSTFEPMLDILGQMAKDIVRLQKQEQQEAVQGLRETPSLESMRHTLNHLEEQEQQRAASQETPTVEEWQKLQEDLEETQASALRASSPTTKTFSVPTHGPVTTCCPSCGASLALTLVPLEQEASG